MVQVLVTRRLRIGRRHIILEVVPPLGKVSVRRVGRHLRLLSLVDEQKGVFAAAQSAVVRCCEVLRRQRILDAEYGTKSNISFKYGVLLI